MLLSLERFFNRIADALGALAALLLIALLFNVFYDVVMRYLFNDVSIGMQELEWHLFSSMFLLGVSYAIRADGHVRVDIFYERGSAKTKALINLFGCLLFLFPFTLIVAYYSYNFAYEAYEIGEGSGDPGGLPHRWAIKGMILVSFVTMTLSGLGMILNAINTLLGQHQSPQTQD